MVLARGVDQRAALGDSERERLLGVDVQPGLARANARQHAPVVRRADDDRVEVLGIDQLPIILKGAPILFLLLKRFGHPPDVAVADRHDLPVGGHVVHQLPSPTAGADEPQHHAVIGPGATR